MSQSVPSDSSTNDPTFLVGTELVQFDRRDLPIYAAPQPQWDAAGVDETRVGMPLDRIFGEPGDVHVDGSAFAPQDYHASWVSAATDDPLVMFPALSDGVALAPPLGEHGFDPTGDGAAGVPGVDGGLHGASLHGADLHLGGWHVEEWHDGGWNAAGSDTTFDFLT
jgi:hypothetical protein